ncbi:MAG TPA: DUF4331 domain-containing protein [Thermomicrobiaceae bacterium]|nr:DUF4331 domain-containing protein [Thermomicrobiaceae bacterium]
MSSHREAPETMKDPVADNTDVYAFVSPDRPDYVTLIANYIPIQEPAGGPYYFLFGDDVLYEIYIDNNGDAMPDITYQFRFTTQFTNPDTFLYNTGQINSLNDPDWNVRQFYSVTKVMAHGPQMSLGTNLPCPPCNVGPRSTPNYEALAAAAIQTLPSGETVFAGQRDDGFYVDTGAIFDLGGLRPFNNLHLIPLPIASGIDDVEGFNVHTIALQIPKQSLTSNGQMPTDPANAASTIGVWASASRKKLTVRLGPHPIQVNKIGEELDLGPWVQVSRLANPLFNEVLIPVGKKDLWNALDPSDDGQFLQYVLHPELGALIPVLYPGVFPHLAALTAPRTDLQAILLTGIPAGIIPGFQNFTGPTPADLLRLNMAIPPTPKANANILGVLGGDLAGFPNGRRVFDDVVTIELRAIAGLTYKLVVPSYVPDPAASAVTDGVTPATDHIAYLDAFPYLGTPSSGYSHIHDHEEVQTMT